MNVAKCWYQSMYNDFWYEIKSLILVYVQYNNFTWYLKRKVANTYMQDPEAGTCKGDY